MDNKWIAGFAKSVLTPADWQTKRYNLAGFGRGIRAQAVLDDIFVRSVYLEDPLSGRWTVLAAVDCIGICNKEVNEIRDAVRSAVTVNKNGSVHILSTHVHASPDTQGLWGKGLRGGRNEEYMKRLKIKAADCVAESIKNAKKGCLYFGKVLTENMIADNRLPFVHDDYLVRFRFEPDDGSNSLYILNIGCHPELLGDKNNKISADWPAYCGRAIKSAAGAEFIFINGAAGAITCEGLGDVYDGKLDGEAAAKAFGNQMASFALSVEHEQPVRPYLKCVSVERILPVENKAFALASKLKFIKNDVIHVDALDYKKAVKTEVSYLLLGDVKILLVPGEVFPELLLGGFLEPGESASGKAYDHPPLFELLGDGEKLVFGLADDQIGYIIPDNDFYLSPKLPYAFWAIPKDSHGRPHYEETTCSGPYAAEMLREAVAQLIDMEKREIIV